MLKFFAKYIWKFLPYQVRLYAVRRTQTHFTASVVAVIFNEKREVLVLDHLIRPGATWGLPGGFCEPEEQPIEAIQRELKEETGISLKNIQLIRVRTIRRHHEILFRAESNEHDEVRSPEIKELGWFALDKIPDGMSEIQKNTVRELYEIITVKNLKRKVKFWIEIYPAIRKLI